MEKITFIIAIISLGGALAVFIANLLNFGLKGGILNKGRKSTKWVIGLFIVYIISFAMFIFISSN
ncbi:hypothetical protein [Salipaludibacillus agaradhaerens]|jgi:hypothetical protein|uniref:hypothetical protein n=1 Tax=Salipaludibacillus agaradhaerens TaxID=76935 RepID=UPI0009987522|nr:hypothetical protein [Salipaludibacillus agaradhaerens]